MRNNKHNYQRGESSNAGRVPPVDLTLRLGSAVNETQVLEENEIMSQHNTYEFSPTESQTYNTEVDANVEFGSSSSIYGGTELGNMVLPLRALSISAPYAPDTTNLQFYHGILPQNPTTPRRRNGANDSKSCRECGSKSTPLWRKGPHGPQTLCNACGLRHLRNVKRNAE